MNLQKTLSVLGFSFLFACGCGGGGGGDSEILEPSRDACNLLRPRILTGSSCEAPETLPVAAIRIVIRSNTFLCSGALIAPRFVLTAGHCLPAPADRDFSAIVSFGSLRYRAARFVRHPQYLETPDPNIIMNDVGVLELESDVPIAPLPLDFTVRPVVGDIISIFGYGEDDSRTIGVLRSGQMRITEVGENQIFALYGDEGSNTCDGDSGGPATLQVQGAAAIVGVTSSGTTVNCVQGDNSSFAFLQNPSIQSFILTNVPDIVRR